MKNNKYDWKNVEIHFQGKKIETVPVINYSGTKDNSPLVHNINFQSKKEMITAIKNIGIELIYGKSFLKPIGYKQTNEEFEINDEKKCNHFYLPFHLMNGTKY